MPKRGEVFFDRRRPDRSLRLSPHPDAGVVVLSIWNGGICQATFQLPGDQVAMFDPTVWSAASAARLIQPVLVGTTRQARNPVTSRHSPA